MSGKKGYANDRLRVQGSSKEKFFLPTWSGAQALSRIREGASKAASSSDGETSPPQKTKKGKNGVREEDELCKTRESQTTTWKVFKGIKFA